MSAVPPGTDEPARRSAVRPEIQALRAGAAMLVVLYHLWPESVPGGFIGVDVFFVISGFLITAHLVREGLTTGRVRLGAFWARRARRLLPAALLVLVVSTVAVLLLLPFRLWRQNLGEVLASALYVQNWRLGLDAVDYLAADNAPSVAQHYWTLSVEEQFYLLWPLLVVLALVAASRSRRSRLAAVALVVGVVTAASFAYSWWLTGTNGPLAYFSTPARAWEFGAGALLALVVAARSARGTGLAVPAGLRAAVSWSGLAVIGWCALSFSEDTAFPGLAALGPVLATVAVIAAGAPPVRWSPSPAMGLGPVRWLGDVSYPLYLWHWPPIVVLPFVLDAEMGSATRAAILVGVVVAAGLTKRLVEDPVRAGRLPGTRRTGTTLALAGAGAAVVAAACLVGMARAEVLVEAEVVRAEKVLQEGPRCFGAASIAPGRSCDNPALARLLVPGTAAVVEDGGGYPGCDVRDEVATACTFGPDDTGVPHVVVTGDSHARSLLPAFRRLADEGRLRLTGQVKAGCPWSDNTFTRPDRSDDAEECYRWRDALDRWFRANAADVDLVVTSAYASPFQSGPMSERVDGFARAWETVLSRDVPVVAVRDNPAHADDPVLCLSEVSADARGRCALPRTAAFPHADPLLAATRDVPGSTLLDLTPYYCDAVRCPAVIGGAIVYRDRTHVSGTYMESLAPFIAAELEDAGLL